MKKLLIVNNNMKIGGVQKALVNLLNEIAGKDYEITLFLFSGCGEYINDIPSSVKVINATSVLKVLGVSVKECKKYGIKYYLAKIIFNCITKIVGNSVAIKLACFFEPKMENYDVAISYMQSAPKKRFYGGTNEFVLTRVKARKKVSFVHCDFERYGGDINYANKMYNKFDDIAVCSKGCKESFIKMMPQLEEKCKIVYNCINTNEIKKLSDTETIVYKEEIPIISVGRMTYEKGMDVCIRLIYRYVNEIGKNIHLYLIGDGHNKLDLENLVDKLNLKKYVTFCGNQRNVYRYMKNSTALLLLSKHEAAPMVFDEASVLKVPVLSTNTTSVKEMVLERNLGYVGLDEEELYEKLIYIIKNHKSLRKKICIRNNEDAVNQFIDIIN